MTIQIDPLAASIGLLTLLATAYLAWIASRLTRHFGELQNLIASTQLVQDFDIAVLSDEKNVKAVERLRPSPPGIDKRQEHLLWMYLNHLDLTYRMCMKKLLDRTVLDAFVDDGIEYFRGRRPALKAMLSTGYGPDFGAFLLARYDLKCPVRED